MTRPDLSSRRWEELLRKVSRNRAMFLLLLLAGLLPSCVAEECEACSRPFRLRTQASATFCLTAYSNTVRMNTCDDFCSSQIWIANATCNFVAADGDAAFMLTNIDSRKVLRHRLNEIEEVDLTDFAGLSSSILWTLSPESYDKARAIRPFENTRLNLDVDHGDLKHGGTKPYNRLRLFQWKDGENQLWEFIAV